MSTVAHGMQWPSRPNERLLKANDEALEGYGSDVALEHNAIAAGDPSDDVE